MGEIMLSVFARFANLSTRGLFDNASRFLLAFASPLGAFRHNFDSTPTVTIDLDSFLLSRCFDPNFSFIIHYARLILSNVIINLGVTHSVATAVIAFTRRGYSQKVGNCKIGLGYRKRTQRFALLQVAKVKRRYFYLQ